MVFTADERETVISWSDADKAPHISTCQKPMINKLRKNPGFQEISFHDGVLVGVLPVNSITVRNPRKAAVKREMPNVQKCCAVKADGSKCQAIADAATGRCGRHKDK